MCEAAITDNPNSWQFSNIAHEGNTLSRIDNLRGALIWEYARESEFLTTIAGSPRDSTIKGLDAVTRSRLYFVENSSLFDFPDSPWLSLDVEDRRTVMERIDRATVFRYSGREMATNHAPNADGLNADGGSGLNYGNRQNSIYIEIPPITWEKYGMKAIEQAIKDELKRVKPAPGKSSIWNGIKEDNLKLWLLELALMRLAHDRGRSEALRLGESHYEGEIPEHFYGDDLTKSWVDNRQKVRTRLHMLYPFLGDEFVDPDRRYTFPENPLRFNWSE